MSILSRAATAVLGVLGLLGRALETVLAVVKGLDEATPNPGSSTQQITDVRSARIPCLGS
jgi:hypothetical protein